MILRPLFNLHGIMVDFFYFRRLAKLKIKLEAILSSILSTFLGNSGGHGSTELIKTSFESANILTVYIFPGNERSLASPPLVQ